MIIWRRRRHELGIDEGEYLRMGDQRGWTENDAGDERGNGAGVGIESSTKDPISRGYPSESQAYTPQTPSRRWSCLLRT